MQFKKAAVYSFFVKQFWKFWNIYCTKKRLLCFRTLTLVASQATRASVSVTKFDLFASQSNPGIFFNCFSQSSAFANLLNFNFIHSLVKKEIINIKIRLFSQFNSLKHFFGTINKFVRSVKKAPYFLGWRVKSDKILKKLVIWEQVPNTLWMTQTQHQPKPPKLWIKIVSLKTNKKL
jgi:hypothetical protein